MEKEIILQQLRSGQHKNAVTELYKSFPSIRHFIKTHGGNDDEAKDVFQEALIVFYKKALLPDFTLTSSVQTYLFSVSKYLWKDELKKKNKLVHFEVENNNDDAINHFEEEEKYRWLDKILNSLGEKCTEILRLFYYKKQSLDEIARQLDYKNIDTVKTQKYKCIERAKLMANEVSVSSLKNEL